MQVLPALQQEALDHPPVTRTLSSHLPAAPAPPWPAHISGQRQKPGPQENKRTLPCLLADCVQTRTQRLWGDCFIFPANITTCASASTLCVCVYVCAHVHTPHSLGQQCHQSISRLLCIFIIGETHLKEDHWVHNAVCTLSAPQLRLSGHLFLVSSMCS